MTEKQGICSASVDYVHLTRNQLHRVNKQKLPNTGLLKNFLLKMHRFKEQFVGN